MQKTFGYVHICLLPLALSLQSACTEDANPFQVPGAEASELGSEAQQVLGGGGVLEHPPGSNGKLYDEQRGQWLADSDRDGTPDEVESAEGTDPANAEDYPGAEAITAAFTGSCASSSFRLISYSNGGLCIHTDEQSATIYTNASNICRIRHKTGRVCTYEDLAFVYRWSAWDASYNALDMWIGNLVADDGALRGNVNVSYNSTTWNNFEANAGKAESRQYWCCHTPD